MLRGECSPRLENGFRVTFSARIMNCRSLGENVPVSVVVTLRVKSGCENAFEQWLHDMATDAMNFEGHIGVNVIRPKPGSGEYTFIYRYRTSAQLKEWLDSEVRARRLAEVAPLCEGARDEQQLTGMETWFTLPDKPPPMKPPPRHKMAAMTLIAVFPIITVLNMFVVPHLSALPSLIRVLVVCISIVLLMTYLVMPLLTRLFFGWLYSVDT